MQSQNIKKILFASIFIAIISIPVSFKVFDLGPVPLGDIENRKLTEWPNLANHKMAQWPPLLDAYFKDQLVFRGHFIMAFIRTWEGCLEAAVKLYVTGRDGELFVHRTGSTVFAFLGVEPLSRQHITNMKLSYAGMQAYLKIQGIDYLVVTIPDKPELYSELLPFWSKWKRKESRYQQIAFAFANTPINVLHMNSFLQKEKNKKLYNTKFDVAHWNGNGLEIAYKEMTKALSGKYKDFSTEKEGVYYKLSPSLQGFEGYEKETVPFMEILRQENFTIDTNENIQIINQWYDPKLLTNKTNSQLTLLLATDSYFMGTHTFPSSKWLGSISPLAHHVKNYIHIPNGDLTIGFCAKVFKKHRPNIVVEAFVERMQGNVARATDTQIRVLGDALLETPGYILTSSSMENERLVNASGSKKDGVFVLTAINGDPMIIFKPLYTDTEGRAMVMALLDSPADTVAQIFYAHKEGDFTKNTPITCTIKKGQNLIHMQLFDKPNEKIWMRFDPGAVAGEYRFLPLPEVNQIRGGSYGL